MHKEMQTKARLCNNILPNVRANRKKGKCRQKNARCKRDGVKREIETL